MWAVTASLYTAETKDAPPGAQVMRMVEVAMVQHVSGALATEGAQDWGHSGGIGRSAAPREGGAGLDTVGVAHMRGIGQTSRLCAFQHSRRPCQGRARRWCRTWQCLAAGRGSEPQLNHVYVMKTPLVGLEALGVALGAKLFRRRPSSSAPSHAAPAGDYYPGLLEHAVVVISTADAQLLAFDFLPLNPTSPITALALLLNGATSTLRCRPLRKMPRRRTWRVGPLCNGGGTTDVLGIVGAFHSAGGWHTAKVQLGRSDCTTYTTELCMHLTGIEDALALDPARRRMPP
jgi:hypothetical protein